MRLIDYISEVKIIYAKINPYFVNIYVDIKHRL